jgi:hypothetical protein
MPKELGREIGLQHEVLLDRKRGCSVRGEVATPNMLGVL